MEYLWWGLSYPPHARRLDKGRQIQEPKFITLWVQGRKASSVLKDALLISDQCRTIPEGKV